MLLALSTHTEFNGRLIGSDYVRTTAMTPIAVYVDRYGNRISRAVADTGTTIFWSDLRGRGLRRAGQCAVLRHPASDRGPAQRHARLPHRQPLLRFRFAGAISPGRILGNTQEGWPRVQAICTFVHNHVTFGYKFGRPDKTARDVLEEKSGVCRDFAHLGVSLCRAMNIPARYASGYLGRHRRAGFGL